MVLRQAVIIVYDPDHASGLPQLGQENPPSQDGKHRLTALPLVRPHPQVVEAAQLSAVRIVGK
eukprot:5833183-Alexandrium_andersonii.AAC.1